MEKQEDSELVGLVRAGNKRAFDLLVIRHQSTAQRVAIGMVGDLQAAQDLVQEALLQAYLSLSHLRKPERFGSWFFGIVLNVCRSYIRSQRAPCISLESLAGGVRSDFSPLMSGDPDPQRVAVDREFHRRVLAAVNALPAEDRAAILLFYYEEQSVREVAVEMSVSEVAVKDRLHRARRRLRQRLLPVCPEMARDRTEMKRRSALVKATIDGVYVAERNGKPDQFVTLVDEAVTRLLHIWIGQGEALAISIGLDKTATQRPLTFDLIVNLLEATGGKLEEVRIESLRDNIYYATLKLRSGKKVRELDARPSDALALAVRTGVPIYTAEEVLEHAGEDASWIRYGRKPDYDLNADFRFADVSEVWERLTERARRALVAAREEAGSNTSGTEHLLVGLLQEPQSSAVQILEHLGILPEAIRAEIDPFLKPGTSGEAQAAEYSTLARRAIDLAWEEAEEMNRQEIGTEHLLLGLLREAHGRGGLTLRKLGADLERAREVARQMAA